MSVNLSPVGGAGAQFCDNNGNPLNGGKLYTYSAGTTTPAATYTSAAGSVFHPNPIILNAGGRVPDSGEIWLSDNISYKFVLKTSADVLIATWDNINGINSNFVNYTIQEEVITATSGQTVFNLSTITYAPGTNSLAVYIDGVNQIVTDSYVETDANTVTFVSGLHDGALVKFTTAVPATGTATNANVVSFTGFKSQSGVVQDLADNDGSDWIGFLQSGTGAVAESVQDKLRQTVSVKDFGAVGDGVTDDAQAIDAAVAAVSAAGGGTVMLPSGTYLLGTLSSDANSQASYITPKDGVSIVGVGIGASILKVKSGENTRFYGSNSPNVIATKQATPLTNCVFQDFTIDWNGANNLLDAGATRRQNAGIMSLNGGININVQRVEIKETPGNQCIFFPASSDLGQNGVTIRDCIFKDSGSGLVGNYNTDHSSVYCNGSNNLYDNNIFTASQQVAGAAYEIHGDNCKATNNKSHFYSRAFWIGSDFKAISGISVSNESHDNIAEAFALSAPTYAINQVSIDGCVFTQQSGLTLSSPSYFINGFTIAACDNLTLTNNKFIGQSYTMRFLHQYKIATLVLDGNYISGFDDYGILTAGLDLGGGYVITNLIVQDNIFNEVKRPLYFNAPTLSAGQILIQNNTLNRSSADANAVLTFALVGSLGQVSGNLYSTNYSVKYAGNFNGLSIYDKQITIKGTTANRPVYGATGMLYLDTTLDPDGKPIWAAGGGVWVDATGAVV